MQQQIESISFTDTISILTYLLYGTLFYEASGQTLYCSLLALRSVLCVFVQQLFLSMFLWQEEGNKSPSPAVRKATETSCMTWGLDEPAKLPKNAGELEMLWDRKKTKQNLEYLQTKCNYFLLFRLSLSPKIVK